MAGEIRYANANMTTDDKIKAIKLRLRLLDELDWADLRAQRDDYEYDPYGDAFAKRLETKSKLQAELSRLNQLNTAENKIAVDIKSNSPDK